MVECLLSLHKVLGSILNTRKQTYFLVSNILGWNSSLGGCLFWRKGLPSPDSPANTHTYTLIPTHTPTHFYLPTQTPIHLYLPTHISTHSYPPHTHTRLNLRPYSFQVSSLPLSYIPSPFLGRVFTVLKSPFFLWGHPTMPC